MTYHCPSSCDETIWAIPWSQAVVLVVSARVFTPRSLKRGVTSSKSASPFRLMQRLRPWRLHHETLPPFQMARLREKRLEGTSPIGRQKVTYNAEAF